MIGPLLWLLLGSAAPQAKPPLDIVMMVDVSHSVAYGLIKRDRALVHDAGTALAAAIEPGDVARVGTFGDKIALDETRLREGPAIQAAADALGDEIGGASPIWDALVAAASALGDGAGRRGILLITDGRSTGNRLGFTEALERLQRARIPVFVVSLDRSDRPLPDPGARLITLARATGGACVFVERPAMRAAIGRALSALRRGPS